MTYIAFEWLSVLWRIIPAHVYISLIVLSWGLIASLQSVQTSFTGMLIMRILLGIGEAGFTGIPIYLSFFFKRSELALRTGYFLSAAPLATSFASSLAWAIMKLDALIPIAPWRLLFIVEGFPAIFIALLAFRIIPDTPAHATFLNVRQRKIACLRLQQGVPSSCAPVASPATLSARDLIATLRDPKNYLTALMLCLTNISLASMPVFLPTIIHSMGHTSTLSQALSAPPYLVTFCIVLLTARLSDRHRSRGKYIIFHSLLSSTGYIAVALVGACGWSSWLRYACLFPAVAGFFSVITLILTWSINNAESEARKGWAFAMMQIVGQCGPLLGTRIYPKKDGPLYLRGMLGCAGAMLGVAAAAAYLMTHLKQRNQKLDESEHDARRVPANQNDHDGEDVELISHGRQLKSDETRFRYIL